jgi:hypothetical protein
MKKQTMAVLIATMLMLTAGGAAHADDAGIPNDIFSVTVPAGYAGFTKQVQTTKSPEGDIETTNWISKAPTGEAVVVTMSRMPGKILDPQKMIASTRESLLKSLGATLESEEPRAGELPSSRLFFRSNAAWFRARFTVLDDRFYQLLYVGRSDEQRNAAAVSQMFESFRIANTAPATPQS